MLRMPSQAFGWNAKTTALLQSAGRQRGHEHRR